MADKNNKDQSADITDNKQSVKTVTVFSNDYREIDISLDNISLIIIRQGKNILPAEIQSHPVFKSLVDRNVINII
jgi:hypothetical protein